MPPLFVLSLLAAAGLAVLGILWPLALGVSAYMLVDLAVSLWLASRSGYRYLLVLPAVFPVMHIAYGAGFLTGLIRFADRWKDEESRVLRAQDRVVRSTIGSSVDKMGGTP